MTVDISTVKLLYFFKISVGYRKAPGLRNFSKSFLGVWVKKFYSFFARIRPFRARKILVTGRQVTGRRYRKAPGLRNCSIPRGGYRSKIFICFLHQLEHSEPTE